MLKLKGSTNAAFSSYGSIAIRRNDAFYSDWFNSLRLIFDHRLIKREAYKCLLNAAQSLEVSLQFPGTIFTGHPFYGKIYFT
ncbi:MAG: hypothetical protein DDT25_01355 [Chloroflexi bacterium]|nr:hypothetical protein [Chloroflexota bacterium]